MQSRNDVFTQKEIAKCAYRVSNGGCRDPDPSPNFPKNGKENAQWVKFGFMPRAEKERMEEMNDFEHREHKDCLIRTMMVEEKTNADGMCLSGNHHRSPETTDIDSFWGDSPADDKNGKPTATPTGDDKPAVKKKFEVIALDLNSSLSGSSEEEDSTPSSAPKGSKPKEKAHVACREASTSTHRPVQRKRPNPPTLVQCANHANFPNIQEHMMLAETTVDHNDQISACLMVTKMTMEEEEPIQGLTAAEAERVNDKHCDVLKQERKNILHDCLAQRTCIANTDCAHATNGRNF